MYDRLPGRASVHGASLSDEAVRDWGTMAARVGRDAARLLAPVGGPGDALGRPARAPPAADARRRRDPELRELVAAALDRYEQVVAPVWPSLRAQFVHTDLCASNVLVDDDGQVTGIIDFGDASWSALVVDLVAVLETVVEGREGDEFFRAARLAIDGYEKVTPLEPGERAILGELLAARMCAAIVVPASRGALYDDPESLQPERPRAGRGRPPPARSQSAGTRSRGGSAVASRGTGWTVPAPRGTAQAGDRAGDDEPLLPRAAAPGARRRRRG